jgi:hypothetical protein
MKMDGKVGINKIEGELRKHQGKGGYVGVVLLLAHHNCMKQQMHHRSLSLSRD